jgi:hypothetical protein
MSEEELRRLGTIVSQLSSAEVAEALKNLKITLENAWDHQVEDEDIVTTLSALQLEGTVAQLRQKLVTGEKDQESLEKWGKALLVYLASDEALLVQVEEAVEDAKASSTMFVYESLLILGGVVVLLKWRPEKFEWNRKKGLKILWDENDVSVVSELAKAASGMPTE